MRAVAAVIIPWIVWGLLDNAIYAGLKMFVPDSFGMEGQPTSAMHIGFLVLRGGYSVLAGWLAVRIAGTRTKAVQAAIVLLFVTGLVAQAVNWKMSPIWYHLVFLASIIPCAGFGVRRGQQSRA